jgi:hypothetical protein
VADLWQDSLEEVLAEAGNNYKKKLQIAAFLCKLCIFSVKRLENLVFASNTILISRIALHSSYQFE